jgi:hypothetical protein
MLLVRLLFEVEVGKTLKNSTLVNVQRQEVRTPPCFPHTQESRSLCGVLENSGLRQHY